MIGEVTGHGASRTLLDRSSEIDFNTAVDYWNDIHRKYLGYLDEIYNKASCALFNFLSTTFKKSRGPDAPLSDEDGRKDTVLLGDEVKLSPME
jgi:hypothetical protein